MSLEQEKFNREYQAGIAAFERGEYRISVQHLETAIALSNPNSRAGGEAQIWLVTALEAAGQRTEAIALCKQLSRHPALETRQQAKRLQYILEAPQLSRRPEWLTQIPDLTALSDSDTNLRQGGGTLRKSGNFQQKEPEPIDLSQVNTKDNRFIWFALVIIGLTIVSLIWFNFS